MTNSEQALQWIEAGQVVGLGSGRAASAFIRALAQRVQKGLSIRGVPTSSESAALAESLGIPLVSLDEVEQIDITVDGADEVDPHLNLIKGLGGALVREKIVAAASRRLIILVGPEKLVSTLGQRGVLPVEVVPFGAEFCRRRLEQLDLPASLRSKDGALFITDNGNYVLDSQIPLLTQPRHVEQAIRSIPGVVSTGLFLDMADTVLVDDGDKVRVLQRPST